jgi:hypothetical protein
MTDNGAAMLKQTKSATAGRTSKPCSVDAASGEIRRAQIFVAVLAASNYTYACATATQSAADWVGSIIDALEFIGAVPRLIVPDQPPVRSSPGRPLRADPGAPGRGVLGPLWRGGAAGAPKASAMPNTIDVDVIVGYLATLRCSAAEPNARR